VLWVVLRQEQEPGSWPAFEAELREVEVEHSRVQLQQVQMVGIFVSQDTGQRPLEEAITPVVCVEP